MTSFTELGLCAPILKALAGEGYDTPTPIQSQAIPHVMAGRDLLGIAQTGTGKTAAFALPILHRLQADKRPTPRKSCRTLVLSPTRELASQIADSFRAYGRHLGLSCAVVFGGVSIGRQIRELAAGVDVVVATPGRLLDLIGQRAFEIGKLEVLVLDEADQMLDMGFIHDIRKLVKMVPTQRQSLFFSATMPKEIAELAGSLLKNPEHVSVAPVATTAERVDQQVIFVDSQRKQDLLHRLLADDPSISRALVFSRTKHGADKIVRRLEAAGFRAAAIHGNKSQNAREKALADFKAGKSRLLVATDIAARGIDVDAVSHVLNFDLPNVPESYVHRIGRTARAGAAGIAISFCCGEERAFLRDIERLTRQKVPVAPPPAGFILSGPSESADTRPARDQDDRGGRGQRQGRPGAGRSSRPVRQARHGDDNRGDRQPADHHRADRDHRGPRDETRAARPDGRAPRQENRSGAPGQQARPQQGRAADQPRRSGQPAPAKPSGRPSQGPWQDWSRKDNGASR